MVDRETRESLERTLAQLATVQASLETQRQEQENDSRREKEQEVKLMIDSVAAAELDNLR
jgi:septal ring factor EnvC (AmiA/AmiB activator)